MDAEWQVHFCWRQAVETISYFHQSYVSQSNFNFLDEKRWELFKYQVIGLRKTKLILNVY
jgi:hypothetical protein